MPRYKLRVPAPGTFLYGDGDAAVVAHTIDGAREHFRDESDEPAIYLHSYIGRCEVLYKRDIENGDGHDGAEPGDTTVWYTPDDGRDLGPTECRVWMLGPPPRDWRMEPMPPASVHWRELPDGMRAYHKVLGWGTADRPRAWRASGMPIFTVQFDSGHRQDVFLGAITLHYSAIYGSTAKPPPTRYRLTVEGELVAEGINQATAEALRAARISRLNAEWEAEQFAAYTRPQETAHV